MGQARHNTTRLARPAAIGLCVALAAGCAQKPPPYARNGKAETERGEKDARAESRLAMKVVVPGAPAEGKAAPEPKDEPPKVVASKSQPRGNSAAVVCERVSSPLPYPTEAEAEKEAITQACEVIEKKLAELDPPIYYRPSPAELRNDFLSKEKDNHIVREPDAAERKRLEDAGLSGNRVYVEFDVVVTAEQVRELRSRERIAAGLRALGGLFALAVAGFLFLRADEWTKGYLTSWLALAAVTLAGAAAAALIFI